MPHRLLGALAALGLGFAALALDAQAPSLEARQVAVRANAYSAPAGRAQVLGMWALPAKIVNGLRLSSLSDLAWDEDERILYAVSDKGALFSLRPLFKNDTLVDILILDAVPLRDIKSGSPLKGRAADAEGMDILNGGNGRKGDTQLLVSFERLPRIVRYRPNGQAIAEHALPAPLARIEHYRNANKALESVANSLRYGIVTAPEQPLKEGSARLFALSGRRWSYSPDDAIVSLKEHGGRLLVLTRDYQPLARRTAIAVKRMDLSAGAAARAETLISLDSAQGWRLDNFEGLSVHRDRRVFLISDNNELFFQRTLLMYAELP